MLKSVQEFTKNFFYEKPEDENTRPIKYEPYRSRRPRNMASKYYRISSHARRNRPTRYEHHTSTKKAASTTPQTLNWKLPERPSTGILHRCMKKLPGIKSYIHSVFSNDSDTINHLQKSCEDITLQIRNDDRGRYNEDARLRRRIQQSKAFKTKLHELKYDKEQLEKLRRARKMAPNGLIADELSPKSIENDRIYLLKNENRLLKRDLESTKNELDITKKRLDFTLGKNAKYAQEISDLKLQLNDYKLMKLAAESSQKVEKTNDIFARQPNLHNDKLDDDFPFDAKAGALHRENRPAKENFDNLSPISVDYSRYSDSPDVIGRI